MIKPNHCSGGIYIVDNPDAFDWETARKNLKLLLEENYYHRGREWVYKHIKPMIIVEEKLSTNGEIPKDYKVHCFNGEPKFIHVDSGRFNNHTRNVYDLNWNLLDVEFCKKNGPVDPKPKHIHKMLNMAKKVSKEFKFARVDFYEVDDCVYFGEVTFYPDNGFGKFNSLNIDRQWGDLLKLT